MMLLRHMASAHKPIKKLLLITALLFPPYYTTQAIDHRPDGIIALGALIFTSALYLLYKEPPETHAEAAFIGVSVPVLMATGVGVILYAHDIVREFDKKN